MNPSNVLFLGGDVSQLASVKIRCREIAERLGCDAFYEPILPDDIPRRYKAFICVKPIIDRSHIASLSKRGLVIWDILDNDVPWGGVDVYIASTKVAASIFYHLGKIVVIPHYHCNFERTRRRVKNRTIGYVGNEHWYPKITGVEHERYFVHGWCRDQVVEAYRNIGIAMNLRNMSEVDDRYCTSPADEKPVVAQHVLLNSGIKLINCLGFGIPSVSACEPAYFEIGAQCTLFGKLHKCCSLLHALQDDDALYNTLRSACVEVAEKYHIEEIVKLYKSLIREL